jgi:arsenite/tail-anchored protein-transporting ATPase
MATPSFLGSASLQLLIFGGKGGVGKTTCASASALYLAKRSPESSLLLVSTDPAHSLADSLADLRPPENLKVLELDPQDYLNRFKQEHADHLRQIALRGTFLEEGEINRFLDLSLPGLDELMAFLEISAWVENRSHDCIIVDTAPSGHTLRLMAMPEFLRRWLVMLETLLAKHRYMKRVFARSRGTDELDAFLEQLTAKVEQMEAVLQDPVRCCFVPVMLAEPLSVRETAAIVREVSRLKLPMSAVVINRLYPEDGCPVCRGQLARQSRELRSLFHPNGLSEFVLWGVPFYMEEVRGQKALDAFWGGAERITQPPAEATQDVEAFPAVRVEAAIESPAAENALLIFAGKGGVGKTTLACATALHLAQNSPARRVLLFSTGPAHSLANCLDMPLDSQPKLVCPGLTAMEIDSEAEFRALKDQYAGDVQKFLESISSNYDLTFDREVLERVLDLSPPGLDEVMGLTGVMALLGSRQYDVLVLDSAATGHLIRLLELPEIISQWLRVFFDLFLTYEQVFRLTNFSQKLVSMSKNLKKLRQLLSDPTHSALYAVSIPTEMAFEETQDLLAACRRLGIGVSGIFLNQVTSPSDCTLCSALHGRESRIRRKLEAAYPDKEISVVYHGGEIRGVGRLRELGGALYQGGRNEGTTPVQHDFKINVA